MHWALLHTQTAKHHGCNEFVHCCMPRPQSIVFHIASMATTRMSLFHSKYLQCYLKFVTSMMLCGLGMQQYTMHNATIQKTTFFELGVLHLKYYTVVSYKLMPTPIYFTAIQTMFKSCSDVYYFHTRVLFTVPER